MRDRELTWLGLGAAVVFGSALIIGPAGGQQKPSNSGFYSLVFSSGPGLTLVARASNPQGAAQIISVEAMKCQFVMKLPIAEIGYSCVRSPVTAGVKKRVADL